MMVNKEDREEIYIQCFRAIRDISQAMNYMSTYDDSGASSNLNQAKDNLNKAIAEFNEHE